MIKENKQSVSYKNMGKRNKMAKKQESAFEEYFYHFVKKPLFGFLKNPKQRKVKLVKYPVSDEKHREPDFIYIDKTKEKPEVDVIEVKSSLNSIKKVDEIVNKYAETRYGGKKMSKIIIVSNTDVPLNVMKEIGKRHLDPKQVKVYVVTPRMMRLSLEEEMKKLNSLPKKRRHIVEGYEKAFLVAREIAEKNQANANKKKPMEKLVKKIKIVLPQKPRKKRNRKHPKKNKKQPKYRKRY